MDLIKKQGATDLALLHYSKQYILFKDSERGLEKDLRGLHQNADDPRPRQLGCGTGGECS